METSDIRWKQRFSNLKNAYTHLQDAVTLARQRALSDLEQQGLIKAYEFTYELSWNVLKDFLTYKGITGIIGSRDAVRVAFKNGIITEGEVWMQMVNDRNLISHTYDKKTAQKVLADIQHIYEKAIAQLIETLEQNE